MVWLFTFFLVLGYWIFISVVLNVDMCEKILDKRKYKLKGINKFLVFRTKREMIVDEKIMASLENLPNAIDWIYVKNERNSKFVGKWALLLQIVNHIIFVVIISFMLLNEFTYDVNIRPLFIVVPYLLYLIGIIVTIIIKTHAVKVANFHKLKNKFLRAKDDQNIIVE